MLAGILKVLFLYLGKGLVCLGYGKKGSEARNLLGRESTGLSVLFSILTFIWLFFGVFFFFAFFGNDTLFSLIIMISWPVVYIIWVFCARSKVPALMKEADTVRRLKEQDQKTNITKSNNESLLKRNGF